MAVNASNTGLSALAERAFNIRRHALRMGQVQGQGYVGQALELPICWRCRTFTHCATNRKILNGKNATVFICRSVTTPLPCMQR